MKLEELEKDTTRLKEGVICVVDSCISKCKNDRFESYGELCPECDAGFYPDSLDLNEINRVRRKYSNTELEN